MFRAAFACEWLDYEAARGRLEWDSNRTVLWELHSRLTGSGLTTRQPGRVI